MLSFYEKANVIESIDTWQLYRATRNLTAHDYETDYSKIAEHFNALHELLPALYADAARFVDYCNAALNIYPANPDFEKDFHFITWKDHNRRDP